MSLLLNSDTALVLFSGGQDSATCLGWALQRYGHVETLAFDYHQRHVIELDVRQDFLSSAMQIFPHWKDRLGQDHHIHIPELAHISQTAMTEDIAIEMDARGLPTTFVPGRNLLFLTYAAALAYRRGIRTLVTGVCETDFSGYPDCRDDTIKALQVTLNLGMDTRFVLETPLMWKSKAETWELAYTLGGQPMIDLLIEKTHSCYIGDRQNRFKWGYGCGVCPACTLRKKGWHLWQKVEVDCEL